MPRPDVTELLADPDFACTVMMQGRHETVGPTGRASYQDEWVRIRAIVQPATGLDLVRADGSGRTDGTLTVWTVTPLTDGDPASRLGADRMQYRGRQYVVDKVEDWLDWGDGFVKAICELEPLTPG